jgi:hypothetical protein
MRCIAHCAKDGERLGCVLLSRVPGRRDALYEHPAGCGIARVGASPWSKMTTVSVFRSRLKVKILKKKVIFLAFGNPSTRNPDLFLPCQFQ